MITGERQIRKVREAYLKSILSQEIGWFDTTKSSELSTRIVSDTDMMSEAIGTLLILFFFLRFLIKIIKRTMCA